MAQTATQIATDGLAAITSSTTAATNLNPGSVTRSLVDTFSAQASVQEQETEDAVATAILNALYQFTGLAPAGASGSVYNETFTLASSATASVTLPSGTAVAVPQSGLQWVTGQSITVAPGASVSTTVACTTTGIGTNVPANAITQLVVPVVGMTVTNPSAQPTVAGRDTETTVQLQAQLSQQVAGMNRSVTTGIEAGAVTSKLTDASGNPTEIVAKALEVDSNTRGLGYCFVFNGTGPMSSALLTQTQNVINGYTDTSGVVHIGYKAAGVTMTVVDAPETTVNVSAAVFPRYTYTLSAISGGVQTAIQTYFSGLDLGQAVSLSQLAFQILAVPGVADVQISSPSASLPAIPYLTAPGAPTVSAVTVSPATSLAAGTYLVGVTYTNQWGETTASTLSSVTIGTAGQAIQVGTITLPSGATGVNYYLSAAGGSTVTLDLSGTGAQTNLTAAPASGAASPPTTNTAELQGNAYILGTVTITQATS